MKKLSFKTKLPLLAFLVAIAIASTSCNRGIGCPNNFSVQDLGLEKTVIKHVVNALVDL